MQNPFTCETCGKSFTRTENLERHQRAKHERVRAKPYNCNLCSATFTRSDVCKRHKERCARGLYSRNPRGTGLRGPQTPTTDMSQIDGDQEASESVDTQEDTAVVDFPEPVAVEDKQQQPTPSLTFPDQNGPAAASLDQFISEQHGVSVSLPALDLNGLPDFTNEYWAAPLLNFPQLQPDHSGASPSSTTSEFSSHRILSRIAAPHATAYFTHFHHYMPIVHRGSFSLVSSPELLVSIVVAIGSRYASHLQPQSTSAAEAQRFGNETWRSGLNALAKLVKRNSAIFRETWFFQSSLLHAVYGFFFGDTAFSSESRALLQVLINNMRTLGYLNHDLTFPPGTLWSDVFSQSTIWDELTISRAWALFASQESFRLCIYALTFCDLQVAASCNGRAIIYTTELNWELPPSSKLWEAQSGEEWFDQLQQEAELGLTPINNPSRFAGFRQTAEDRLTLTRSTQSLMTGKPSSRLLKMLSRNPFTTACIVSSLEALIRDFTHCLYQMPPNLPDPSPFHVLSQSQNRSVNAAIHCIMKLNLDSTVHGSGELSRLIQLSCLSARVSLCEPDDLLVAGIVDTTIPAGLATSMHLIMGSHVATRRAVTNRAKQFGEEVSLTVWEDFMRGLAVVVDGSMDNSFQEAPWVTVLSFRIMLIMWRTLRRAVQEVNDQASANNKDAGPFGQLYPPATQHFNAGRIMLSIFRESMGKYLSELAEDNDVMRDTDQPVAVELQLMSLMLKIFSGRTVTPITKSITDLVQEAINMISGSYSRESTQRA